MNRWIAIILTLAVCGTVSQVAMSQGDGADNQVHSFAFLENLSMVLMPDGHSMRRQITDQATADMILKNAKPIKGGMIFFMHDGKIYMTKDEATAGGPMLSSVIMHPKK